MQKYTKKEDMSRQFGKLNDRRMAIFSLKIRKVMTATLPWNEWNLQRIHAT